jgi:hypothetical protein
MSKPVLVKQETVWSLPPQYVPEVVSELRRRLTWAEVRAAFMPDGFVVFDTGDGLVRMDPETAAPIFPEPEGFLEMDLSVDELDAFEEDPLPTRMTTGPEDWRSWIRKGPGNGWKVHRETRYRTLSAPGSRWDRAL